MKSLKVNTRSYKNIDLIHFAEKSDIFVSDNINCGVYIFSRNAFDLDIYLAFGEKYSQIVNIS